jgi:hypothetical protein
MSNFLSRKFLICLLAVVSIFVFTVMGKMDIAQWTDTIKWIIGLYLGANVVQKFSPFNAKG